MPQWSAFAWLAGVVITGFLLLARVSQSAVRDADGPAVTDVRRRAQPGRRDDRTDGRDATGEHADTHTTHSGAADTTHSGAADSSDASAADSSNAGAAADGTPESAGATPGVHRAGGVRSGDVRPPGEPGEDRPLTPAEHTVADAGDPASIPPGTLLANVALTQGLFGALVLGGAWFFRIPAAALGAAPVPLSTGLPALAVGVALGVLLWAGNEVASGLAASSGADYDEDLRTLLAPASPLGWVLLLGAALPIVAGVEELLFRAAAVGAVSAGYGASPWALAVVSSAAFALGHGAQGRVGVLVTGALGFALAAAFVATNSLLAVVVAHYLVNALEFVVHEGLGLPDPVWAGDAA